MGSTLSRVVGALVPATAGFLRALGRIGRQLAHEISGALFAVFVVVGAMSAWRAWQQGSPLWVLLLSIAFALGMGYFAVTSFWRAYRS